MEPNLMEQTRADPDQNFETKQKMKVKNIWDLKWKKKDRTVKT